MSSANGSPTTLAASGSAAGRVVRHALVDRLFHWIAAGCVLTLLATAFLPILGVEFAWVFVHWTTGLVLVAAVLFHVLREVLKRSFRSIWFTRADLRDAASVIAGSRPAAHGAAAPLPGKYSVAQKLIHWLFALVVLVTAATGLAMLLRIDTPWWRRNPYVLEADTWGIIYVLHGLGALLLITMVMLHVYFALRPEKLLYTRSMILGWITREEYAEHHDPSRWRIDR